MNQDGRLMFVFKYEDSDEGEFVPAKLANIEFPQHVIKYYERCIVWDSSDDST